MSSLGEYATDCFENVNLLVVREKSKNTKKRLGYIVRLNQYNLKVNGKHVGTYSAKDEAADAYDSVKMK